MLIWGDTQPTVITIYPTNITDYPIPPDVFSRDLEDTRKGFNEEGAGLGVVQWVEMVTNFGSKER